MNPAEVRCQPNIRKNRSFLLIAFRELRLAIIRPSRTPETPEMKAASKGNGAFLTPRPYLAVKTKGEPGYPEAGKIAETPAYPNPFSIKKLHPDAE
jgi:hypothetical protein